MCWSFQMHMLSAVRTPIRAKHLVCIIPHPYAPDSAARQIMNVGSKLDSHEIVLVVSVSQKKQNQTVLGWQETNFCPFLTSLFRP